MLATRVQDACFQIPQRSRKTLQVLRRWRRDQVYVIGHSHMAVNLYGDPADDDILNLVRIEHGKDALRVKWSWVSHL